MGVLTRGSFSDTIRALSAQPRCRATHNLDGVRERGLAAAACIDFTSSGIDGYVPETGAGSHDFRRESIESTAMVGVTAAILETAEIRVVHQADVAELGTLDDDDVVFVEMLALVYKFHGVSKKGFFCKIKTIAWARWHLIVSSGFIALMLDKSA
jgi:hypothetical protein